MSLEKIPTAAVEGKEPEKKTFDESKNTFLFGVDKNSIDLKDIEEIAREKGFSEKEEFHITVVGFKNGNEIKKILKSKSPEEKERIVSEIKALVENTDWSFTQTPEKYHISKDYMVPDPSNKGSQIKERRESYIQMVDMPAMSDFYQKLNALLGTSLEVPPAHLTLYTNGDNPETAKQGIGITTAAELEAMNPERI